jgi:hypothetical protein
MNDETPDAADEAQSQPAVEAEEEAEKGGAAKPEGGRIS